MTETGRFLGERMVDDTETIDHQVRWFCVEDGKLHATENCVWGHEHVRVKRMVTPWVYHDGHGVPSDPFLE